MIMLPVPETVGCCTACGLDLERRDYGYWHGARLCSICLADIKFGERKIAEARALANELHQDRHEKHIAFRSLSFSTVLALVLAGGSVFLLAAILSCF